MKHQTSGYIVLLMLASMACVEQVEAQVTASALYFESQTSELQASSIYYDDNERSFDELPHQNERQPMHASNGLASLGRNAWPTVRAYLWEACFKGNDLFAGYARSHSTEERDDVLKFELLVKKEAWKKLSSETRQMTMHTMVGAFEQRLGELNIEGELEIILMNG